MRYRKVFLQLVFLPLVSLFLLCYQIEQRVGFSGKCSKHMLLSVGWFYRCGLRVCLVNEESESTEE